jgi:hypothetical protein
MKRLPLPLFGVKDAVEQCASGITLAARSQALLLGLPTFEAAETTYKTLAPAGLLFNLASSDRVTPSLSAELMGTIYKSHFARVGSPSRSLYDAIRFAPAYGICPLCGQRIVASVDHYLPQSLFPVFNLTPANLIPACSDCNKRKLAKYAVTAEGQTLHPYFDDLGNDRWLIADIGETAPPSIAYRVQPHSGWSSVLRKRVQHHFEVMGLAELYAAQAASELADIAYSLVDLGTKAAPGAVREHLEGEFASRYARDTNSWKTALYDGLRASTWFCDMGYGLVR